MNIYILVFLGIVSLTGCFIRIGIQDSYSSSKEDGEESKPLYDQIQDEVKESTNA